MIKKLITKLMGDQNKKAINKIMPIVDKIKTFEKTYENEITTHEQVLAKTDEFKKRIENGETVDALLPEAFALVVTACKQLQGKKWNVRNEEAEWNMVPYDVQLIGGVVLHKGNISEMKTGEGKTLVCTMPVYLNALSGKGVFVVTVNDYLAHRDAEWMGGLYNYLGLSIGVSATGMTHEEKKAAYECDITYGTNNEFGFDYLRDNMATKKENVVQRNLHYAIVDEVDSILIDEARTPLIISAPAAESTAKYIKYSGLIPQLTENTHYNIDEKGKTAALTEEGVAKMEELLGLKNIYTEAGFSEVHHIEQALRAHTCYKADTDYIVKDSEVVIIDEFTGRLMAGRRYSHGLHQAIEAKENVEVKRESKTLATITFQNYFRMFDKLGGMTGTAKTEAEEFYQIYGLNTIVIPTHRPIVRNDKQDSIYKTYKGKLQAAAKKIKELHEKGQPVLVGTISVQKSEIVSQLLKMEGVPHNVLNAKNHEKEAEIIKEAGQKGAITIATNMAGRGTDIKLGEDVKKLGGLFVLGTERHESRRIDNQLRGRSGRQGDAGTTQFFASMEDDLMRLFGGERMKKMMDMLKVPEDMPIENGMITKSIENSQKKVEGRNFDIRKHLVEYDDVINIHREIIYKRRKKFLFDKNQKEEIEDMIKEIAESIVTNHTDARPPKDWDYKEIYESLTAIYKKKETPLSKEELSTITKQEDLIQKAQNYLLDSHKKRETILPEENLMRTIEQAVFIRTNDTLWMEHIDELSRLREDVAFSGYAQKDPLNEYKAKGFELFNELLEMIKNGVVSTLFKIDLSQIQPKEEIIKTEETSTVTHNTFDQAESKAQSQEKVGRNDPCPCESGKKYKKCCGKNK